MSSPVCLIDADSLAFASAIVLEPEDRYWGTYILDMVDEILEACGSSEPPIMYLTGDGNFRYDIATVNPYKEGRPPKPYHLQNARCFIQTMYNTYTSVGCEADDLLAMSLTQYRKDDVPCILCSIDKDLDQVEGWHYKWETHNAPEAKPYFVEKLGELRGEYDEGVSEKTGRAYKRFLAKKFKGTGYLWFMAQTVMGDAGDKIPGIEGVGAKVAYESLVQAQTEQEALEIVTQLYKKKYEDDWQERLTEQARLVFMIRERDRKSPDGLKHWSLNYGKEVSTTN